MSVSSKTPPERVHITQLTEMDKAVILFHSFGEEFVETLDLYLSSPPNLESYIFKGPDYLLLGHRETRGDPTVANSPEVEPFWYVSYGGTTRGDPVKLFLEMMPYHLDRVAFSRHAKDPTKRMRYFNTNQLLKYYGIKT